MTKEDMNSIYFNKIDNILEFKNNNDEFILKSQNILIGNQIYRGKISINKFIKDNFYMLEHNNNFKIYYKNNLQAFKVLKTDITNEKEYIAKFIENINGNKYEVSIFIDNVNEININIQRVNDDINLEFIISNLYIDENEIEINGHLFKNNIGPDEKNIIDNKEYKIIAYTSNGEVYNLSSEKKENQILSNKISINELNLEENYDLYFVVICDNRVVKVRFKEKLAFRKIFVNYNDKIKTIYAKANTFNDLIVNISDEINIEENQLDHNSESESKLNKLDNSIEINPKVNEVKYADDKLILNGKLNSNLNEDNLKNLNFTIKFKSRNKKINIENKLENVGEEFSIVLSKKELFEIKNLFSGDWDICLGIEGTEIEEPLYLDEVKSNIVLSNRIYGDRDSIIVEVYLLNKENEKIALKIKASLNITQILSMIVGKRQIKVKYRTSENVELLLNSNLIKTNIYNGVKELECKKVEKIGKKTYVCYYKDNDCYDYVEKLISNGATLYTNIDNEEIKGNISDINKYSIFYRKIDVIRNSGKYKRLCNKVYNKIFLKLPVKKKRVLFESFLGRNISGNPKYIYKYFVENGLDKEYELIWILNNTDDYIEGKHKNVKRKTLKYYYYMATSGYWVFNARQADEIIKRNKTVYLQTWHGTPYKALGNDMFNASMAGTKDINEYKERFYRNSRRWDYLISQNDYASEIFKRAFDFNKVMLNDGYPANDILYKGNNEEFINKLKDKYKLPKDKKVILYAPTWREDNFYKKGHYKMDIELDLKKLKEKLEDDYIIILRMHYLITNSININDYSGFVYNLSDSCDIQELYLISDIMITDYSSTMFDYANLRRLMIFFTYDIDKYTNDLRGCYFDLEEIAPGPVVKHTEEVIDCILNSDLIKEEYKEKEEAFYNKFCHLDDGNAAKRIFEKIFK